MSAALIMINIMQLEFFGKFLEDELVYFLSYKLDIGFLQLLFLYKF